MTVRREEINLFITDESIGIFQQSKTGLPALSYHLELEKNIIENGYIKEPETLLMLLKTFFKQNKIRAKSANMVIHDQNLLIRELIITKEELQKKSIINYIHEQTGKIFHFPFDEPNISYVIKSEDENSVSIIVVITDENLLQDYHDVFDLLGVGNVSFNISANVLYQIYHQETEKQYDHLMIVSVFDHMLTINVMEKDIPVFGMIEEFEGNLKSYDEMIESYIERVANYYRFNLKKGLEAITDIVIFNFSGEISDKHITEKIKPEIKDVHLELYQKKQEMQDVHEICIMAYAESILMKSIEPQHFNFSIDRVKKLNRYANYIMVLSFAIFTTITLIYIPLFTFNEDINIQTNMNSVLQHQLDLLQEDNPIISEYTDTEIDYSNTYDFINQQLVYPSDYYRDLLDQLYGSLEVVRYSLNTSDHEITIMVSATSYTELFEYAILIKEAYGISDTTDDSRWIVTQSEKITLSTLLMEVTIQYA